MDLDKLEKRIKTNYGEVSKAEKDLLVVVDLLALLSHARAVQAGLESAQADVREYEEKEAPVCPEDTSFTEVINSLRKHLAEQHEKIIMRDREFAQVDYELQQATEQIKQLQKTIDQHEATIDELERTEAGTDGGQS